MAPLIKAPRGLAGIVKTFGDIESHIAFDIDGNKRLSPEFEKLYIVKAILPQQIQQATADARQVKAIRCHRLLADTFRDLFAEICSRELSDHIHSIDGCFVFRHKRPGTELSTHSWGIAIDINASTNYRGTNGDMNQEIVEIFKTAGFNWGGDWRGTTRDPMHFQFCTGY